MFISPFGMVESGDFGSPYPYANSNPVAGDMNGYALTGGVGQVSYEPPLGHAQKWAWDEKHRCVVDKALIDNVTVFPLELSTMPGFAGSSGYYLRYMDPKNDERYFSEQAVNYWQNVDLYVGGAEHGMIGHVLGPFSEEERPLVASALQDAASAVELIVAGRMQDAQAKYNHKGKNNPRKKAENAPEGE